MGRSPTDTREKLIATATELIWRHSYGAVSVDDICKAADVKKGSFYHFFPSKADLAMAAMDHCFAESQPEYDAIFSAQKTPLERFRQYAEHIYVQQEEVKAKYGQVCGCPFATLGSELAGKEEAIREKCEEMCGRHLLYYESAMRDLITEGLLPADTDVKAKAEEISAFIMGQMLLARIHNSTDCLKDTLAATLLRIIGVAERPYKKSEKQLETI